jgi:putative aminopeptidase FrvX
MALIQEAFSPLPLEVARTRKGGLVLTWLGSTIKPRALTAHTDTLGAMVRRIKDNGRLALTQIGGYDWHAVENEGCTIASSAAEASKERKTYRGTIVNTKVSVHIFGEETRKLEREAQNYEVRIDARTANAEQTQALGINVGDFVYLDPHVEVNNGFIRSRHLDDKAGVAAIYGALLALHQAELAPRYRLTVLISNYEEAGHGAAAGISTAVHELVAVDMAAVGEGQASDEFSVGICAKDSGGPYHLGLRRALETLAREHDIPYKVDTYPHYGSDGEAAWHAGADLKVGLIGPGVEASHAYERTHTDSLEATAALIAAYLLSE